MFNTVDGFLLLKISSSFCFQVITCLSLDSFPTHLLFFLSVSCWILLLFLTSEQWHTPGLQPSDLCLHLHSFFKRGHLVSFVKVLSTFWWIHIFNLWFQSPFCLVYPWAAQHSCTMMTNWYFNFDVFKTKLRSSCGLPHPSNCQLHPCNLAHIKILEGIPDVVLVLTSVIQSNRKSYLGLPLKYIPNLTTSEHLLLTNPSPSHQLLSFGFLTIAPYLVFSLPSLTYPYTLSDFFRLTWILSLACSDASSGFPLHSK